MAYNGVDLAIDPLYLQTKSYDARSDRKWFADLIGPGIVSAGDYAVTYSGSALTLNIAAGVAYVKGGNIADQGMYREYTTASVQATCPAADATNPRIDTVILRVFDNAADASALNKARIDIVPGTPTAGATLANLNGKNALTSLTDASLSFIVLAYVLVPNAATVLTNTATNVLDARTTSKIGGNISAAGIPIGASLEWNSTTLPPSSDGTYLVEDGSAISRTTYATAFARLGTGAGVGDGSTTFNIPDSVGRMPVAYAPSGGHTDVSTMFANEGKAKAFRRPKHQTSKTDPGHGHNVQYYENPGYSGNVEASSGDGTPNHITATANATTGITVGTGNANDPLDSAAYIVKNKIIRVA